jgi:iron complex outermembrane receptor protein
MAAEADAHTVSSVLVPAQSEPTPDQPLSARRIDARRIAASINALTVEDTLKYLPNFFVRRRHIGDTQAPITTRTSGVGASARSLIYTDGVLLSALIGNNNSTASPRWGMVAPEEIQQIDVLYGPFSAVYPGNSVGAVVNITTRSPQAFEAQAKVAVGSQAYSEYSTKGDYPVHEAAAGIGDRRGAFAWRLSGNHLESRGQPLGYATATRPAAPSATGAVTTGAFNNLNRAGAPVVVLGATGLEHQVQDNAKLKLEWAASPALAANLLLGYFNNRTDAHADSYLRDATGAGAYSGALNINGYSYNIAASVFANGVYHLDEVHWMQALSVHGSATSRLSWQVIATDYDYGRDVRRAPSTALPGALVGGAGTILELGGTGWRTLDAKAVWTPDGALAAHAVSLGLHRDLYELGSDRYNTTDWLAGARGALAASSHGKTETWAAYLEDAMRLRADLSLTLGVRQEHWRAFDGLNYSLSPALNVRQPALSADRASPKAVLAWTPTARWRLSAAIGRAYRFPTVSELYQAVTVGTQLQTPNPNLRPERALSTELSAERTWTHARLRISGFTEDISGALNSQTAFLSPASTTLVSFVQNVDKVRSRGVEAVGEAEDVGFEGLDISVSATYVDSITSRDTAFPAAVGKRTPQVPRWRWTAVAIWRPYDRLTLTAAARYGSHIFATIDNSDTVGHTYQGFESYLVVDARATWKLIPHWSVAVGVDNLNNRDYFIFHPFPQRSVLAELHYVY